ncbi:MAG: phosphomethylpyrimidine synthase ThiC [Candidatus Diapherotrites archaeon]|nr:phosphomethylpyrimidine synthase ThiC [Candidatus Diapherotrites archaeon]
MLKTVARKEGLPVSAIKNGVSGGTIVVLASSRRKNPVPVGVGKGLRTKINVNVGTSSDIARPADEIRKARIAVKYGADAVMDLSTCTPDKTRKKIIAAVKAPVGTVPIYEALVNKALHDLTEDDFFNAIQAHLNDGVDFVTIHAGVTRKGVAKTKKRTTGIVSRGGAILSAWMAQNGKENPLYTNFDYVLEMLKECNATISLGDGLRPGSIADATDAAQLTELRALGTLVLRARKAGVQAMVEGPGHIPVNQIIKNVELEKRYCHNAPFYVLGPLVTDVAPGYDHITAAIGGAIAGAYGADFLCDVTPSEHLCLPDDDDIKEATITAKIAAHAADICKGIGVEQDRKMSEARHALDWDRQLRYALDKEKPKKYLKRRPATKKKKCTMCGELCAMRLFDDYVA